jgi:hypothetical protein
MLSPREREAYRRSLRSLLRPVVRDVLSRGIPYPALDGIVRELYVETAARDFALPGRRSTDSRVSLLTGLHRKEVARLRVRAGEEVLAAAPESIPTRIIGRWMATRGYVDERGRCRAIPYEARGAGAPSFVRLVRDLGIDVPARSVLDEMLRVGAVEELGRGRVRLRRELHLPPDRAAKLALLGTDPGELFATIAHNIDAPDASWLQRKVAYDNLGADALPELREAAKVIGTDFVRSANALLAARDRDRNPAAPGGRRSRAMLGVYYCEADCELAAPPPEAAAPTRTAFPRGRGRRRSGTRST